MAAITIAISPETLEAKPESVTLVQNFGDTHIVDSDNGSLRSAYYQHCIVEGDAEEIRQWLKPFSPVWRTVGSPQLEQFELTDIR